MSRQPMIHELKCHPEFFMATKHGLKPWELRKNDRDYQPGDYLKLTMWSPASNDAMGNEIPIHCKVIAVYTGKYLLGMLPEDMVLMTIEPGDLPF